MNLNQEFHEHLQAGRTSAAIALVVGQLVELKITTKANSGRLHTTVDLLSGQITNTVDPAFFSDKASQKLLEFHTHQITATAQVVREQLRSLQDLLQVLPPPAIPATESVDLLMAPVQSEIIANSQTSETLPVALLTAILPLDQAEAKISIPVQALHNPPVPQPATPADTENLAISPPAALDSLLTPSELAPSQPENHRLVESPARVKLPDISPNNQPLTRIGIASGLAAALSNAPALDPSEAATIPNKFDQALKSAGVRSTNEEDLPPFGSSRQIADLIDVQPVTEQPTEHIPKQELIDLLSESEEDWDEWLLEEDNILAELSDVTKNNMPDLEAHWLSATTNTSAAVTSSPSDWEEFMPEYPDINHVANKNQANVERFRQNLVNDPQLMSELLAELDDLEATNPQP
jgi:hypothetical protein